MRQVVAARRARLEAREVGVDNAVVRLHREQQRDVHVEAVGDERLERDAALGRTRHLDHHVRPRDGLPQAMRLLHRGRGVVRGARRDLDRHEPIGALRGMIAREERVAGAAHVVSLDEFEKLPGSERALGGAQLRIVGGADGERLLEDRGIRRHTGERIVADAGRQLAVHQHGAVDVIQPDGLAGGMEGVERSRIIRHDVWAG